MVVEGVLINTPSTLLYFVILRCAHDEKMFFDSPSICYMESRL